MEIRKPECATHAERRNLNQTAYWMSLSRSFDKRFVDDARSKYDKRNQRRAA